MIYKLTDWYGFDTHPARSGPFEVDFGHEGVMLETFDAEAVEWSFNVLAAQGVRTMSNAPALRWRGITEKSYHAAVAKKVSGSVGTVVASQPGGADSSGGISAQALSEGGRVDRADVEEDQLVRGSGGAVSEADERASEQTPRLADCLQVRPSEGPQS